MNCRECGAEVSNTSKHRSWHSDIERKLRDLETKATQARRDARRARGGY